MEEELPNGDADGKLYNDQLLITERVAAERPGGTIRMSDVIERIIARDNFERPVSPLARMPATYPTQRAGPSGLNAHMLPVRRRVDSFDKEKLERPVLPQRRLHFEFENGDYLQKKDAAPKLPKQWK